MGLKEFFAMEASEYLDRLDVVVSVTGTPDREEFVRLARALRGSALMANEHQIGQVAEALENFARAVSEHRVTWDEKTKHIAILAVDDLRILIRKVGDWSAEDDATAAATAEELNAAAGTTRVERPSRPDVGINAETRAFVARECATVASAMTGVAQSLDQGIERPEQFDELIRTMQPLRGLAVLSELSPLPEVMDGIERATGLTQRDRHDGEMARLFDAGARALSQAAQEIASLGSARPDSPEAREFASQFGSILDASEVLPIQSLYYDDDGPHVLEAGTVATAPGRFAELELVAHGEHLKQAADELERAQWDTQRELRALALTSTFRSLMSAGSGPLERAVSRFAAAAQEAVSGGAALHHTQEFVEQLRDAGAILTASAEGEPGPLGVRLAQATTALLAIPATPPVDLVPPEPDHPSRPAAPSGEVELQAPEAAAEEVVPVTSDMVEPEVIEEPQVTPAELPEVEIAAVEEYPEAAAAAELETELPVTDAETADLAGGWARYERLQEEAAPGLPSIDEWLEGTAASASSEDAPIPTVEPGTPWALTDIPDVDVDTSPVEPEHPATGVSLDDEAVPISELAYDGSSVVVPEPAAAFESSRVEIPAPIETPGAAAIPIAELCYSGPAAVQRAHEIRDRIRQALAEPDPPETHLQSLVDELVDLVGLSLD
jgi:chemotaxis protein histidine kinase CheA